MRQDSCGIIVSDGFLIGVLVSEVLVSSGNAGLASARNSAGLGVRQTSECPWFHQRWFLINAVFYSIKLHNELNLVTFYLFTY